MDLETLFKVIKLNPFLFYVSKPQGSGAHWPEEWLQGGGERPDPAGRRTQGRLPEPDCVLPDTSHEGDVTQPGDVHGGPGSGGPFYSDAALGRMLL